MRVRRPRQLVVDTLIALIVVSVAVRRGQDSDAVGWPDLDARAYWLLMLAHLPLVLRSRAPIALFGPVLGASVVYISLGYWPVISTFGTMLALYTVTSLRSARQAVGCGAAMVAVWVYSG